MKHLSAIMTALLITAVIGFGIVVIGVNALTNTNTVALQNSPNDRLAGSSSVNTGGNTALQTVSNSADVQQLQQQVSNLQSQLTQASQTIQQYQSLLMALQQRGVIFIDRNGNIFLHEDGGG